MLRLWTGPRQHDQADDQERQAEAVGEMGRKRRRDPASATPAPAVPAAPAASTFTLKPEWQKAMVESIMANNVLYQQLAERAKRAAEPKPMKLTDAQLEQLLVAIQDGEVNYGTEDCEVIGELICEVLEHRRKDRTRQVMGGGDPRVQPPVPDPSWWYTGSDPVNKIATEQRIRAERARMLEQAQREKVERAMRYGSAGPSTQRVKGEPFWQADVNRDVWTLYAPNGQKLYTVSGMDMLNMKNPQTEMGLIAEREVAKWRANGGS